MIIRYYTADVEFWHLNDNQYPPTQLPINVEQLGELCEALILVFDSTKVQQFVIFLLFLLNSIFNEEY